MPAWLVLRAPLGRITLLLEKAMKAKVLGFGKIEVEGEHYDHDIVIDAGEVKKRKKGASKRFRDEYGHTPLSAEEKNRRFYSARESVVVPEDAAGVGTWPLCCLWFISCSGL